MNLLARLNSQYPWLVLLFWLLVFVTALPFATAVQQRFDNATGGVPNSQWQQVNSLISSQFNEVAGESYILVSSSNLKTSSPRFLASYNQLLQKIKPLEGITSVARFDTAISPVPLFGQSDGRFITVSLISAQYGFPALLGQLRGAVKNLGLTETKFYLTGAGAVNQDFAQYTESDVKRGELTALPLTAFVLIFAFGALVAAGLPILVGALSITLTLAALFFATFVLPVSSFAQSVVTLFGLGAGIDYALLVVSRFREVLPQSANARVAAYTTTLTAGRAVVFSGLTVAIAMSALLVPDLALVRSMGVAGLLTMLLTVLVSITALPALLGLLGERVNSPRILRRLAGFERSSGFWGIWADRVMAHPRRWGMAAATFILLLAAPALSLQLGYTGAFGLAPGVESRRGLELLRPLGLAGGLDTLEVLLDLGENQKYSAESRAKWRVLDAELARWADIRLVASPFSLTRLGIAANSSGSGVTIATALAQRSLSQNRRYLRMQIVPRSSLRTTEVQNWTDRIRQAALVAGFSSVLIGGAPQSALEITQAISAAMPVAIGLVFLATFLVLMIAFRSILIPLKSIVLNSLSVAASYGIITLVFQHGVFAEFFNAPKDIGFIDATLPLVLFAIIFGLSMDYEIFLLTRMQEAHLAGADIKTAVRTALQSTAGVITSAALIMVIVFAAFIPGQVVVNKTIGLGLSVAVALDATIVRLILVPALMVLANEWNWWLPPWLERLLPKIKLEH